MNRSRALLSLTCAGLLAGCAVGPDYQRPTVDTPAFREAGNWKPAEPSDQLPRGKWWQALGDPVLNALEDRVEVSSNTLHLAEAQYRQALAAAGIASAPLFPSLNATGSASRSHTATRGTVPGTTSDSYAAGLSASWEFDLWGRVRRSAEAGRATAEASAADLEGVRLSVHALVAQTYFSLRVADTEQQIYTRLLSNYERFLTITRNRYKQDIASQADVSAAESQLKTAQAQALDLGLQRSQLEHALAVLLGQPPVTFSIAAAPLELVPPTAPAVLPSQLLERRPDIAAAERRLASACAQIGVAKGGYFPVLSLSGSAGYQAQHYNGLFSSPNEVWAFGASALAPLFDGGKVRNQVAQARAAYDASLASYRQVVLTAFQEVEDNLVAGSILANEALLQNEALAAARRSASITLNQYQAGTVSYLNVVTAQTTQLQAERNAVELLARRLNTSVALYKATGGSAPLDKAGVK